ncbi:MAG: hypothetical protein U0O22_01025 [Acutalibacteraceae bacterium]
MAFMYNKEAYDISLFETEETNVEENKKSKLTEEQEKAIENAKQKRVKLFSVIKYGLPASGLVALVVCMILGQVQLTELNQQISNAKTDLEEQRSMYIQAEMKVEAMYSSAMVEQNAQAVLGMSRADTYQKEYISLAEGDKAEVSMSGSDNIFEAIANAISSLWS